MKNEQMMEDHELKNDRSVLRWLLFLFVSILIGTYHTSVCVDFNRVG